MIPVYNEANVLEGSISTLNRYLTDHLPYDWRIVIVDNASKDETYQVAEMLSQRTERVEVLRLEERGRGRALRTAWMLSKADVVSYMDVDLSTDLSAYHPMVRAVAEEGYDAAIGCRLGPGAAVVGRRPVREITSRGYNLLTRLFLRTRVRDAQCGFKAISRTAADALLSQVVNDEWFFDTELLIRVEKSGLRIKQVPVRWTDDVNSHVKIFSTAMEDLRGIWRLKREGY
jgi:glycosyltransferase involved in cell wall biosynthesis